MQKRSEIEEVVGRKGRFAALAAVSVLLGLSMPGSAMASASANETRVIVRAVSRGAKVIGDNVGGARVTVQDPESGEVLASAVQRGGTGSTQAIMTTPHKIGEAIFSTTSSAHVEFTLDLAEPRYVEIVAEAPLGIPSAMQRASKTMWLYPGQDLTGEAIVIELAGLVALLERPGYRTVVGPTDTLAVEAKVTML